MNWPDRRPICSLTVTQSGTSRPGNPQAWHPALLPISDEVAFRDHLVRFADEMCKVMKSVNAQGGVVWDIEGGYYHKQLGFPGEPRMLAKGFAPEMHFAADAFFKRLTDNGFRVGVTIRHTEILKNVADEYVQVEPQMPWGAVHALLRKIDYAANRWGASLFYVDTNQAYDTVPPNYDRNIVLPPIVLARVHAERPNVLLIPEMETPDGAYRACSMPFRDIREGPRRGPAGGEVVNLNFSALPGGKPTGAQLAEWREDVKAGSILMGNGYWAASPELPTIRALMKP